MSLFPDSSLRARTYEQHIQVHALSPVDDDGWGPPYLGAGKNGHRFPAKRCGTVHFRVRRMALNAYGMVVSFAYSFAACAKA
jgi:hypothetical protein